MGPCIRLIINTSPNKTPKTESLILGGFDFQIVTKYLRY